MNAQRRTALTRLGLREPRQAHRSRRPWVYLIEQPDDAKDDLMAVALAFVVIVCAAIFAGAVW